MQGTYCTHVLYVHVYTRHHGHGAQVCEHFSTCASGGRQCKRSTVGCRGRQAGITPNNLIAHLWTIAPPPVLLHEPFPPLSTVNSPSILEELKCALCTSILSRPLELMCSALVCTKCLVEWIAASGSVNCPSCSEDCPLVPSHIKPASKVTLLLLSEVLV